MPAYIDQSPEQFHNQIHVGNLPVDVNAKQITALFDRFGIIIRLYFKRRMSIDSPISLPNPVVILSFEKVESVDKVMIGRPYYIGDYHLFVRRCIPITRRYPYEAHLSVNKILVRTVQEKHDEILPNDNMIIDYLKAAGGKIVRLEKFDEKSVVVEFDDYDPVDICCLSRPHFINNQMIEIEKCIDEQKAQYRALVRQKYD
jgi:RNA recognition motif-containing protein